LFGLGEYPLIFIDTDSALVSHPNLALKQILIRRCSSFCCVKQNRVWRTFIRTQHN